jgi:hypothetical protein
MTPVWKWTTTVALPLNLIPARENIALIDVRAVQGLIYP